MITGFTLLMMGGLFAAGSYTAPYGTPLGQVALTVLLTAYAAALVWLRRIADGKPPTRLIDSGGVPA